MKNVFLLLLCCFLLSSCVNNNLKNKNVQKNVVSKTPIAKVENNNTFDKENHLKPLFNKITFDSLHSWQFGWALIQPINTANTGADEILLAKKLSPGQKALYFIWYLDAEVTNGGFIQFYWNDNRKYLNPILDGLKLIGDTEMLRLVKKADKEYLLYKDDFNLQQQKNDTEALYKKLTQFEKLDSHYYKLHDQTMELIEKYARLHPDEFVKFIQ